MSGIHINYGHARRESEPDERCDRETVRQGDRRATDADRQAGQREERDRPGSAADQAGRARDHRHAQSGHLRCSEMVSAFLVGVPILDEAYMQRRSQEQYWRAMSEGLRDAYRRDTPTSLREEYALGKISYAEFERRLERCLRLT